MAGYTINLTEEETKALEMSFDTDNLQDTLQAYLEGKAQSYIKSVYVDAVSSKPLAELKTIAPEVKVERVVPEVKEAIVDPVDIEPVE